MTQVTIYPETQSNHLNDHTAQKRDLDFGSVLGIHIFLSPQALQDIKQKRITPKPSQE
jgi:hypothetical protein